MAPKNQTIELTGFLGRDPEFRGTKEKTFVVIARSDQSQTSYEAPGAYQSQPDMLGDDIAEPTINYDNAYREVTRPSRDYAVMSIAVHRPGHKVQWVSLRAFNIDPHHPKSRYRELFGIRLARKGDQVTVKGHKRTWTHPDGSYTLDYVDVDDFTLRRPKRREVSPTSTTAQASRTPKSFRIGKPVVISKSPAGQ